MSRRRASAGRSGRATLTVRGTLPIPATAARVFAAFAQVEAWRRWDWLGSAHAGWARGEPWRVGSVLRLGHRPFVFECTVTDVMSPHSVTWEGGGFGVQGRHTFRFHDHPGGCLVESHETFTGTPVRVMTPLVRWYWRRHLRSLRTFVVSGQPLDHLPAEGPVLR